MVSGKSLTLWDLLVHEPHDDINSRLIIWSLWLFIGQNGNDYGMMDYNAAMYDGVAWHGIVFRLHR
jgi:hypothetical protein